MTIDKFQGVFLKWAEEIVDIWFKDGIATKPLAKFLLRNNVSKLDNLDKIEGFEGLKQTIELFKDKNGEINIDGLLDLFIEESIPTDGLIINPQKLFGSNFITNSISPKLLERSDIVKLKQMLQNGL